MKKIDLNKLENELVSRLKGKIEGGVYLIHSNPLVIVSNSHEINDEYVRQTGFAVWNSRNFGGTIVAFPGDIDIGILKKDGFSVGKEFLQSMINKLSLLIQNIEIIGNDIIIDGKYKTISYASINVGDNYVYTVIHISLNPNVEIIKKICTKQMIKIPKGLIDYGLTTEDLEEILKEASRIINI